MPGVGAVQLMSVVVVNLVTIAPDLQDPGEASYAGGYAIWLTYGLSTGSIPLIVVDTVGLLCGGLTLAVALSQRGSLIRPATWNGRNTTSISPRPAAPDPQPRTHLA